MATWNPIMEVLPNSTRLLVVSEVGDELLKAELPAHSRHPRALLAVFEGLALYSGTPLCVAISAENPVSDSLGLGAFSDLDERWPEQSALVQFVFLAPPPRGRRLGGVGDFRRLRRLGRAR